MYTINSINHEILRCARNYKRISHEIDNLNKIKNKDSNIYTNIDNYKKDINDLRRHIRYLVYLSRTNGIEFPEDKLTTLIKGYNNEKRKENKRKKI